MVTIYPNENSVSQSQGWKKPCSHCMGATWKIKLLLGGVKGRGGIRALFGKFLFLPKVEIAVLTFFGKKKGKK